MADKSQSQIAPLDELVDELASIKRIPFKVVVGIFFGLAILSVLARAGIRLRTRRTLSLDDYLLFAAAAALVAATGLMYHICDNLYLTTALRLDPSIIFRLDSDRVRDLINNATQQNHAFLITAWTATFLVKFSFLAFFRQLIRNVRKVRKYYLAVVAITVVSWMFLVSEPFILCSDFGINSVKCMDESKNLLYVAMTGLITSLDVITDIMIVSIPIIVLHQARIRTSQKLALGVFLCLSLVMACFAIIRASKIRGASGVDIPWSFFWQFMEASIAVLMGSLTVFRTLLVAESHSKRSSGKAAAAKPPRSYYSFHHRIRLFGRGKEPRDLESQSGLPQIPSATMTGLRTFIRRNHRDSQTRTGLSQLSTLAGEEDALQPLKDKKDKPEEEVDQVWPLVQQFPPPPSPVAFHYPICRPQPTHNSGVVHFGARLEPGEDAWANSSPGTSQTSIGSTTLQEHTRS